MQGKSIICCCYPVSSLLLLLLFLLLPLHLPLPLPLPHTVFCCIYCVYLSFHAVGLSPKNIQPRCELATSEVTCISSWQDLVYIFQKDTKRAPLFPPSRSLHPLLLIHIHKDGRNTSDAYDRNNLCHPSELDDKCTVVAVYSQTVFDVYPAALWVSSVSVVAGSPSTVQSLQDHAMTEISWTLQMPFCSEHRSQFEIMEEYVYYEVSGVFV